MAKLKVGELYPFDSKPKTIHFDKWYGVDAHWSKIPKYVLAALVLLYLLGQLH